MDAWLETVRGWFDGNGLAWGLLGGVSVVVFVASLIGVPALLVAIPEDYFAHARRPRGRWAAQHPAVRAAVFVARNVGGAVLMLAGVAMLALPGQGLLTLLAGFLLVEFPGKYRLEKALIRRRWVRRPVDWLRRKRGREPLVVEGEEPPTDGQTSGRSGGGGSSGSE